MIIRPLTHLPYSEALALQQTLVDERADDQIPDTLMLIEHPEVFTAGRSASPESLPRDAEVIQIGRGGDVTWHGPGQLVGYWIRKLDGADRDLHRHLRLIEEGLIRALRTFDLAGERVDGKTGVWVTGRKVASIGVAVRRWVAWHGFALNVATDPHVWARFRPCGLDSAVMADLSTVAERPISLATAAEAVAEAFRGLL